MKLANPVTSKSELPILWLALTALALFKGFYMFGWVSYMAHLPNLVEQFNFPAHTAILILCFEFLLAIALEPLCGWFADRLRFRQGSHFSLITIGVVVATVLFLAVPWFVNTVPPLPATRWLLPGLLILWGIAMTLFHSPVMAVLRQYAALKVMPIAASLLTFAVGLSEAIGRFAAAQILAWGYTLAFGICAALIMGSMLWLRQRHLDAAPASSPYFRQAKPTPEVELFTPPSFGQLAQLYGVGLVNATLVRLAMSFYPDPTSTTLSLPSPTVFSGTIFAALAIAALPAGLLGVRLGTIRTMLIGLGGMMVCLILIPAISTGAGAIGLAILTGASYSLLFNGAFVLAASSSSPQHTGLRFGALFSGTATAAALFLYLRLLS